MSPGIDNSEFDLQQQGYADAFRSSSVIDAITSGNEGKIAANLVYWSGSSFREEAVEWTLIESAASANSFADAVAAAPRPSGVFTAPGSAIDFAAPEFSTNEFDSTRQVIDVSGDEAENSGLDTANARNNALAAGVDIINGLVVGEDPNVLSFYQDNFAGGSNAFVSQVNSFDDFGVVLNR